MRKALFSSSQYASVKRVLIYRLGSLGDIIVSLPCLHLLERVFPNATRSMLTNTPMHAKSPTASAVIGNSGLIHSYINYPIGTRNPIDLALLWLAIRRFAPEVLVYLTERSSTVERDMKFFRACGITQVVGTPTGNLAVHKYNPASGKYESEAERLARCIRELGDADLNDPGSWDLRLTSSEQNKAAAAVSALHSKRLISCGIGTKQQAKDWGAANWYEFLIRLAKRFPGYGLVLVGTKDEREASEAAASGWQTESVNLCGDLTPRETAAVIKGTELFIGPDSGPMHLAAAVGTPSASVFSAQSKPGVWFPLSPTNLAVYHETDCFGCGLKTCVEQQKRCILSITPDEMIDAATVAWRLGRDRILLSTQR
jgi:ADP-heptose:LPS heptosyltransferase